MAKKKQNIGERRENEHALLSLSPQRWIELFEENLKKRTFLRIDEGAEEWARNDALHGVLLPDESVTAFIEKYDLTEVE